jgi:hypothetical protein
MIATLESCRAGFDGCDAMRDEDVRKHPRTARLRECRHMAIPVENPERLQGPEVGAECIYTRRNGTTERVTVTERSYVWAPGDPAYHGGSRRYDWKVIARSMGRSLVVDDKDLTPIGVTA